MAIEERSFLISYLSCNKVKYQTATRTPSLQCHQSVTR